MTVLPRDRGGSPRPSTLFMLWPVSRLQEPPAVNLPPGYELRTYRPGDDQSWLAIQAEAEYELSAHDLDDHLREYLTVLLPRSLFFAIHTASGKAVATAGVVHNTRDGMFPFGGELSWVATVSRHRSLGLGRAVSAAATARLIEVGYDSIRLGAQDKRLTAIRMYLKMGYQPYLYSEEVAGRWQDICTRISWPFTPAEWPR